MTPLPTLDEAALEQAARALAARDARLAAVLERYGPPPLWARPPGFGTLLHIILEQQVSLASARAAYLRLQQAARPLTPDTFLALSDAALKAIGFSRQKSAYGRGLAERIRSGALDLDALAGLDDESVRSALMQIRGVGRWSADIYLLMVLLRPDTWPHGDRALALSAQQVLGLPECPSYDVLLEMSEAWRPWRAVAARLFWHAYLERLAERAGRRGTFLAPAASED